MTLPSPETMVATIACLAAASAVARNRHSRSRHRLALNRALHELRRPLQAMALLLPESPAVAGATPAWTGGLPPPLGPEPIRQAIDALRDLDREVNGRPRARKGRELLAARLMADACVRRWRSHARLNGSTIELSWTGPDVLVRGDSASLAAALENVLVNAIEHGGPRITVLGREVAGRLRITVRDSGPRSSSGRDPAQADPEGIADVAGHGLGLEIASRTVQEHGGKLESEFGERGSVVEILLPVARPGSSGRGRVKVNW